jgi:hypothetical protein
VGEGINAAKGCSNRDQQAMLINSVQLIETPEKVISSLVRFGHPDCVLSGLAHQLYFSWRVGFVFLGSFKNRKRSAPVGLVAGCNHKLISEMVQSRPQIEENITRDKAEFVGNLLRSGKEVLDISSLRIMLGVEEVWVGFAEGYCETLQLMDVLIGPFNL